MTTPEVLTQLNQNRRGIQLRILSGVLFTAMGLCIKLTRNTIPLGKIVFSRPALALIPLAIFLFLPGHFPRGLYSKRPLGHRARSSLGTVGMIDVLWFGTGLGLAFFLALSLVLAGAAVASSARR